MHYLCSPSDDEVIQGEAGEAGSRLRMAANELQDQHSAIRRAEEELRAHNEEVAVATSLWPP